MIFFKYLFGLILSLQFFGSLETTDWVPVEKAVKMEEVVTDIDPSIWVIFLKKVGNETLSVRLPEDPVYKSFGDSLIFRAAKQSESFEVLVHPSPFMRGGSDFPFEVNGKWVHENVVQTKEHTILLRTYSLTPESSNHQIFVSSFAISS